MEDYDAFITDVEHRSLSSEGEVAARVELGVSAAIHTIDEDVVCMELVVDVEHRISDVLVVVHVGVGGIDGVQEDVELLEVKNKQKDIFRENEN